MAKKEMDQEVLDTDHAEARVYELGFHIDPELGAEEAKKVYQTIRSAAEAAGSVVAEGEPRKIQLAYTVSRGETTGRRDFDASFFGWVAYEATGEGHESVTAAARAENRIFRFLDIRTTKDEARHAAEMHEIMAKNAEENQGEEVSDTELDNALKEVGV